MELCSSLALGGITPSNGNNTKHFIYEIKEKSIVVFPECLELSATESFVLQVYFEPCQKIEHIKKIYKEVYFELQFKYIV